jgi:hypothetical protein
MAMRKEDAAKIGRRDVEEQVASTREPGAPMRLARSLD